LHLKRVELLGFKSFASKTVVELERGITGIVGPNGSGKSNVADALRWAMGEQSLRAVRSRKSDEVIFAGNARKAAVGMAEVTLVFDNSQGSLPLSFSEVSITRRQYRSGEGEYLINRSRARLRDVVELLTHARLGPDGYALVGQGAVDEVLLQRPEERRLLLEAAADISRYQMKTKESLDKLGETERNIRRVEDIRGEIGPQLNKLRVQASRAQRYDQVVRRLKEMTQWRYLLLIRDARGRAVEELEREKGRTQAASEAGHAYEEAQGRLVELRERLREGEAALEAARERLSGLRLARATAEREAALLREREAAYRSQLKEAGEELARARRERAELQAETDKLDAVRAELVQKSAGIREEMGPVEKDWQTANSEQRLLQAQLDRVSSENQGLGSRRSELQARRGSLARDLQRAEGVRRESLQASEGSTARLAQLEGQIMAAQGEVDRLRVELSELEARHKAGQGRLGALSAELQTARQAERKAWEDDRNLQSRLVALRSLKDDYRGVAEGAKAVLKSGVPGIRGTLASMIQVPKEYVPAVASALAEAQGFVVSESLETGVGALGFLTDRKAGGTITPLCLEQGFSGSAVEFRSGLDVLLSGIAFRGLASELVSPQEEAADLCVRYLGFTLVVEGMADALEARARLAHRLGGRWPFQIVTMDGRLVRARGDLVSGHGEGKDAGLLARENELATLAKQADEAQSRLRQAKDVVTSLEASHADLTKQAQADASTLSRLQGEINKRSLARAELASQLGKLEASIEWHRSRGVTAEREVVQARDKLAKLDQELADFGKRESEVRARLEQLRDDMADQQAGVAEVSGRLSKLQSELSATHNRLRELDARTSALTEGVQRAQSRLERQQERVSQLEQVLAQLQSGPKVELPSTLLKDLEESERTVREGSGSVARGREGLASAEAELSRQARVLELAREELANVRSKSQRASVELAALVREAARESGMELEEPELDTPAATIEYACGLADRLRDVLAEVPADSFPEGLAVVSQKVESLRRDLHSMGTINAEAPEEYRQLSERNSFLTTQLEDLQKGEHTLRKAIEELKGVMEARFRENFERVNGEFAHCFSTLFGGGSARLALTQPDQPLAGGVEILVNLPGKKSGSLLGLSGGERALTAIALLFALMRVNPSPFCLLDEVDAALDESNVKRFCSLVQELTDTTQFLVITHNRTTMEMARALHGVSMNPDSTSRIVSLRLASRESEN